MDLIKILKQHGFTSSGKMKKHEKYSNGTITVVIPKKHSNRFSEILAARILKQAKIE